MRLNKYYWVDQFKDNEGAICVAHMGEMRNKLFFRKQKGRDHFEERGVTVRLLLELILNKQTVTPASWAILTQDGEQVMNFRTV